MQAGLGAIALQMRKFRVYIRWMTKLLQLFAAIFLALPFTAMAEDAKMSESEKQALQLALDRGLDLYQYDQAAWHTTDTLREDLADLQGSGIRGWVVTETESGWLTTFWKPDGESHTGVYSAVWTKDGVKNRQVLSGDQTALSAEQLGLIQARNAVMRADLEVEQCTRSPFNTVVLPPDKAGDPFLVYFLVPQTSNNAIPMGKHYRFQVRDGEVVGQRSFTNSCISLDIQNEEAEDKPVGLYITHSLDPVPTETHVFGVFAAGIPIFVGTTSNKHTWSVEVSSGQPRVRLVE